MKPESIIFLTSDSITYIISGRNVTAAWWALLPNWCWGDA